MGFKSWLVNILGGTLTDENGNTVKIKDELTVKTSIKELAINSAVNLIGNALALSEFKTYSKGEEKKENDYYAFNVQPNKNMSASQFWKKFAAKLVLENEVLIIKNEDEFFIVDSFIKKEKVFYPNYYTQIQIDNLKMEKGFQENEVFYFRLNQKEIRSIITKLYEDYGKLIEYSKKSYKRNNAKRGVLEIPTNFPQNEESKRKLNKLLSEQIQQFYKAENGAVLPLTGGIKYTDISSDSYKNATDSTDIRRLVDDIFNFVAIGFQIPPNLLKGGVSDLEETIDTFIKLSLEPFVEIIKDELNRKLYSKSEYLSNTFLVIDTTKIKATNISKLATTIDILTRNGVHSIDENRELIGKEPLRTNDSQKRHITKNYEESKELDS